jgi:uncharacterized protein
MVKFSGTESINAEPGRVWTFLMDPQRFTACAPAMRNVKIKNDREFTFDVEAAGLNIGFNAEWRDRQEPSYAQLRIKGGNRFTGGANLQSDFRISPEGQGSTVDWSSDVEITGAAKMMLPNDKLKQLVDGMNRDVIACIRDQIENG